MTQPGYNATANKPIYTAVSDLPAMRCAATDPCLCSGTQGVLFLAVAGLHCCNLLSGLSVPFDAFLTDEEDQTCTWRWVYSDENFVVSVTLIYHTDTGLWDLQIDLASGACADPLAGNYWEEIGISDAAACVDGVLNVAAVVSTANCDITVTS